MTLEIFTVSNLIALVTLTCLEIVLGIDNIVFISIVTGRLAPEHRSMGRRVGLALAMAMRIGLLFALSWVMGLNQALFHFGDHPITGRDLILLLGGGFLLYKATTEIHEHITHVEETEMRQIRHASLPEALVTIMLMDVIFSLDSVITAVGMADHIGIMITAVIIAVTVMIIFADPVSDFVSVRPTIKMLALAFLVLIGVMLIAEGTGQHVSKGYIYFAMGFSLLVEMLNMRYRAKRKTAA